MRKILKLNTFHLVEKIARVHVDCGPQIRIAFFTNMRILEFRTQTTIAFFAAVNNLNGPLRKQNFTSRVQRSWFVICGFRSVFCVSLFQGALLVIVIVIDGSDKHNCEGGFSTLEFACF